MTIANTIQRSYQMRKVLLLNSSSMDKMEVLFDRYWRIEGNQMERTKSKKKRKPEEKLMKDDSDDCEG